MEFQPTTVHILWGNWLPCDETVCRQTCDNWDRGFPYGQQTPRTQRCVASRLGLLVVVRSLCAKMNSKFQVMSTDERETLKECPRVRCRNLTGFTRLVACSCMTTLSTIKNTQATNGSSQTFSFDGNGCCFVHSIAIVIVIGELDNAPYVAYVSYL